MITCKWENGKDALLRHVVVNALIVHNNQILLVKRAPDDLTEPNKWAIPGGFLDRDENTGHAVIREVKEETGYDVKNTTLFRIIDKPDRKSEDRQNVAFVYTVEVDENQPNPVPTTPWEQTEIKWFPLDQLPPEHEQAFDHFESIELYQQHLKNPKPLPII